VEVVRFFVLAGGVNLPVGLDPLEVATLRGDRLVARGAGSAEALRALLTPPPGFAEDFRALLACCRRAGVRLLPSLASFELLLPAVRLRRGVIGRGRAALVFGPAFDAGGDGEPEVERRVGPYVEAFLDAALSPLLAALDEARDAVEAVELLNEPEWAVRGGPLHVDLGAYGLRPTRRAVPAAALRVLARRGVARVVDAGFVATLGTADPAAAWLDAGLRIELRALAAAGRYVHQRHHHPSAWSGAWRVGGSPRELPAHGCSPITPCLLGELPAAPPGLDPRRARWRDAALRATEGDRRRHLAARLRLAAERGYPMALVWPRPGAPEATWDDPLVLGQLREAAREVTVTRTRADRPGAAGAAQDERPRVDATRSDADRAGSRRAP
jgi:hypothetical protein